MRPRRKIARRRMRTWGAVDGVRDQTNRRRTAGTRATRACHLNLHFAREKKIVTAYVTRSLMISADKEGVVVESSNVCARPGLRPRPPPRDCFRSSACPVTPRRTRKHAQVYRTPGLICHGKYTQVYTSVYAGYVLWASSSFFSSR